jgi:hypothetical protein
VRLARQCDRASGQRHAHERRVGLFSTASWVYRGKMIRDPRAIEPKRPGIKNASRMALTAGLPHPPLGRENGNA